MSITPKVTVFMPVYNGEAYLKAAIDSVLAQTFQDLELLLINDGSTDGSRSLAESFQDPRIRLLDNEGNKGIVYTRNRGLAEAKAPLVALLDCDDVALPERIALQYDHLTRNPRLVMTGGHAEVIDAKGVTTGEYYSMPVASTEVRIEMLFRNVFANSTVMYRREKVRKIGGYHGPGLCEDYQLAFRLVEHYQVDNLDRTLSQYRVHEDNISRENENLMIQGEKEIIRYMHQSLAMPHNDLLQKTHLTFLRRLPGAEPQLAEYFSLLKAIREGNDKVSLFPEDQLNKYLLTKWYELIRQSRSRKSLPLFFKKPLFAPAYATPKMYRKMIKQAFGLI